MANAQKVFTVETLRSAAKQSFRCQVVPVRLRRAIKKYIREEDDPHIRKRVRQLSESFQEIKDTNRLLPETTAKSLADSMNSVETKRWKIQTVYGDSGLEYRDGETAAYMASRMPAVFSVCFRIFTEIGRRLPDFKPTRVLDFGAGTGSGLWAVKEVWPKSVEKVNIVEPSQSMQRAGRNLIQGLKDLPLIHGYTSLLALNKEINKEIDKQISSRKHDLVIASYVLGEIPSLKDRITVVRQLWELTDDLLVLVEPGTPHGANIISQMRSHILWMEKRKLRKLEKKIKKDEVGMDVLNLKSGAHIVAPCPHDGKCPLENTGKYCHFVQRLQRTSSQRSYKRTKGVPLRGFEDEKFCFVAFRRGQRPRELWPLDGMKLETLKERRANKNPEDFEIDYEDFIKSQVVEVPYVDPRAYDSDTMDEKEEQDDGEGTDDDEKVEEEEEIEEESERASVGGGWGRIIFPPFRKGKQVTLDLCVPTKEDGSEGAFERRVFTKSKNPDLHLQAKKSFWGDLWPLKTQQESGKEKKQVDAEW